MSFLELGLDEAILRAVRELGHEAPTPIQQQAIPVVLAGGDLLAAAQTGTGKTGAFAMPILQRLAAVERKGPGPRALILVPTRELAAQVAESFGDYARHLSLRVDCVYGGVGMHRQISALRRGIDVLVATPGRLIDHLEQRSARLDRVEVLVLDEADRMLDMGFLPAIRRIIGQLPAQRQNLLFSATFSSEIRSFASTLLKNPKTIDVAPRNVAADTVAQRIHFVDKDSKRAALLHLLRTGNWSRTVVFARTKHGADRLCTQLEREGVLAAAIHGDKSQGARTRALAQFKQGQVHVLVATDVAARGLDVDAVSHVVNFDLPNSPEDYVHRIGRTGRAGMGGEAVSLVAADERQQLQDIQRLLGRTLPSSTLPGFEPTQSPGNNAVARPNPAQRRRHGSGQAPRSGSHHPHRRDGKTNPNRGSDFQPHRKGR